MDTIISMETSKDINEAAVALRRAAEANKWGVLGGFDFGEILASKGFPQRRAMRSLELCSPAHANHMLQGSELVAACMPCSVVLYDLGGVTRMVTTAASRAVPMIVQDLPPEHAEYARNIDEDLRRILAEAAK